MIQCKQEIWVVWLYDVKSITESYLLGMGSLETHYDLLGSEDDSFNICKIGNISPRILMKFISSCNHTRIQSI